MVEAGFAPRKLLFFQLLTGRIGLGTKPPPQLGHVLDSICSTQLEQNVHSKLQIRASIALGGRAMLQFSQVGLSSSMMFGYLRLWIMLLIQ